MTKETSQHNKVFDSLKQFRNQNKDILDYRIECRENTNLPASQGLNGRSQLIDYDIEYENPEIQKSSKALSPLSNLYSPGNDELADVKRLEGWVRSEAEKYAAAIEKHHHLEIGAFAEQMRLKDEKLEAFRWRTLSMEIESK
ncbi:hypothetical protein OIU76_025528 [Salix suchowensis]|nr:hypothetical protein OIU76_025528 [Salix suchowensis]